MSDIEKSINKLLALAAEFGAPLVITPEMKISIGEVSYDGNLQPLEVALERAADGISLKAVKLAIASGAIGKNVTTKI